MGDKLHNIVRALWVYLVCFHQVLSFDVAKSGQTYVQAGSQTTLTCQWTPRAGIGPLRVSWRQGSTMIATAILPSLTPQYPNSSIKGRVTLGTITASSTSTSITLTGLQCPGDIAEYSCEVITTAMQDSSGSAAFRINLFVFLGNNIDITSSSRQLQAGQHASLTCTASNIGRPPGIMKWYKGYQEITTGFTQQKRINSDGCTYNGVSGLSITPTSQDDGVMYTCVVEPNSTVIGDSTKQGRYTLDVQCVLVGAVVAAVVITLGVAVALFVLYHRGILHRFWKNRQSADTVEVDVTEGNNEYAMLERKPDVNEPDHTYAALQGMMTSFNTPPR